MNFVVRTDTTQGTFQLACNNSQLTTSSCAATLSGMRESGKTLKNALSVLLTADSYMPRLARSRVWSADETRCVYRVLRLITTNQNTKIEEITVIGRALSKCLNLLNVSSISLQYTHTVRYMCCGQLNHMTAQTGSQWYCRCTFLKLVLE